MRNNYADELVKLADADPRVMLLSGDIGNRLFDAFRDKHPTRFLNCGVAEANMMSMAAGMALSGLRPFTYTITPFTTTRCYEQIRVDVAYHKAPVVIAGTGAGLSYAELGATHHSLEDIAIMSVLPGMTVICPGDPMEVRLAMRAALEHSGPVYLRLGKKGEPSIHAGTPDFKIGKAIVVQRGTDVALVATGNMVGEAVAAGKLLAAKGISAEVVSFHTVKPLDEDYLARAFSRFARVVTIEEHHLRGGLGSGIAEWAADQGHVGAKLHRIGVPDHFFHDVGDQAWARKRLGLDAASIAARVEALAVVAR